MENISKGRKILMMIAICLTNIAVMGDFIIIPIINELYGYYPNEMLVNLMLSGPALVQIASGIVSGFLMNRIGPKKTALYSFGLFTVCVVLISFIFSAGALPMTICRMVAGLAVGVVNAAAMALIAGVYTDGKKLGTMMGVYNAAMAGIGALLSAIAGRMAVPVWSNAFKLYWITIPVVVLIAIFVPETRNPADEGNAEDVAKETADEPAGAVIEKTSDKKGAWIIVVAYFFFNMLYGVLNYFVSVYLAEKFGSGADTSGLVASLQTIGSLVFCITFGLAFAKIGRKYSIIPWAVFAIGYLVMFFTNNIVVASIAAILMCGLYGGGQTFYITWIPMITNEKDSSKFLGFMVASCGIGFFLCTYLVTFLETIMGTESITPIFPVLAVACAIILIVSIFCVKRDLKLAKNHQE